MDLREWDTSDKEAKATKKGVSLSLTQFKELTDILEEDIDQSLQKNEASTWHLGANVYVTVRKDNPCVDIRLYWRPPNQKEAVPTRRGLCLRPVEYDYLKEHIVEITTHLPELTSVVPCYMRDESFKSSGHAAL